MKKTIENVLQQGEYDLADILRKINILWVQGALTDDDRASLNDLARNNAQTVHSVDIMAKLEDHEQRLRALEGGVSSKEETEGIPEYQEGKWYYAGDKCSFEGEDYVCIAPEGTVCVWSPAAYPTYWEKA